MIEATVTITTPGAKVEYVIRVPADDTPDDERKMRKVLGASIEMGCALLDAEFSKSPTLDP